MLDKKPTLIVMAAGMGSRYGGSKQVDKMTAAGEIILDFSLYDAMLAGFNRVVFIIREEHRDVFRELVDERAGKYLDIEYAYQKLEDIPAGYEVPEGREKPWGTSHAVMSARHLIDGPFVVINADDYYGPGAFLSLYEYLANHEDGEKYEFCMAGYMLENTVTEHGHVSRGVCELDDNGFLKQVTERTKIEKRPDGIAYTEDDGESWTELPKGTVVSMNFWGFSAAMMKELEDGMAEFLDKALAENPMKSEYPLPHTVDTLIKSGKARVKVLTSPDKWCGVTYKEDKEEVKNTLEAMKDKGFYPDKLWK